MMMESMGGGGGVEEKAESGNAEKLKGEKRGAWSVELGAGGRRVRVRAGGGMGGLGGLDGSDGSDGSGGGR
jgi:hypothetical protein